MKSKVFQAINPTLATIEWQWSVSENVKRDGELRSGEGIATEH